MNVGFSQVLFPTIHILILIPKMKLLFSPNAISFLESSSLETFLILRNNLFKLNQLEDMQIIGESVGEKFTNLPINNYCSISVAFSD